jgi:hypothetical protein
VDLLKKLKIPTGQQFTKEKSSTYAKAISLPNPTAKKGKKNLSKTRRKRSEKHSNHLTQHKNKFAQRSMKCTRSTLTYQLFYGSII